jgi:hypothetical protein
MFFWYIHENIIPKEWKKYSKSENDKDEQNTLQENKNNIDLEELILKYDKNQDIFGKRKITEEQGMQLRANFISDFPLIKF